MSRSDSKLLLYSFFLVSLPGSLDLRMPRKPTGGSTGTNRGVSGELVEEATGETEETREHGEESSLEDCSRPESVDTSEEEEEELEEEEEAASTRGGEEAGDTELLEDLEEVREEVGEEGRRELRVVGWGAVPLNL